MTLLARRAMVAPTLRGLINRPYLMDLTGHWAKRAAYDDEKANREELREQKADPLTKGEQAEKAEDGSK